MDNYLDRLISALISMGPGGVLAGIMFYFYRMDRRASGDRAIALQAQLVGLGQDFKEIVQENTKAVQSNTEVMRQVVARRQ